MLSIDPGVMLGTREGARHHLMDIDHRTCIDYLRCIAGAWDRVLFDYTVCCLCLFFPQQECNLYKLVIIRVVRVVSIMFG